MKKITLLVLILFSFLAFAQENGAHIPGSNNTPKLVVENGQIGLQGQTLLDLPSAENLGSNLVINGTFDADTNYSKSRAVIANGVGTLEVPAASNFSYLRQAVTYETGKTYRIEFDEIESLESVGRQYTIRDTDDTSSSPVGNSLTITAASGTTKRTFEFVATSDSDHVQLFRLGHGGLTALDWEVDFDNLSVREVIQASASNCTMLEANGQDTLPDDADLSAWLNTTGLAHCWPDGVYYIANPLTLTARLALFVKENPNAEIRLHSTFPLNTATFGIDLSSVDHWNISMNFAGDKASNDALNSFDNESYFFYADGSISGRIYNSNFDEVPKAVVKTVGMESFTQENTVSTNVRNYVTWNENTTDKVYLENNTATGMGLTTQNTGNTLGQTPFFLSKNDERHIVRGMWLNENKNTPIKGEGTEHIDWENLHLDGYGKDGAKSHELGTDDGQTFRLVNYTSKNFRGIETDAAAHVLVKDFEDVYMRQIKINGGISNSGAMNEYGVFINGIGQQANIDIAGVQIDDVDDAFFYGYNIKGVIDNFHGNNYNLDPSITQGGYQIQLADNLTIKNTSSTNTVKPTTGDGFGYSIRGTNVTFKHNYSNNSKSVGVLASITGDSKVWDFSNNRIENYSDYGLGGSNQAVTNVDVFKYDNNVIDGTNPLRFSTDNATIGTMSAVGNHIKAATTNLLTLVGTGTIAELSHGFTSANGAISKSPNIATGVTVTNENDFDAGGSGSVSTGFHSVLDITGSGALTYTNQVTGTGYRVYNTIRSGTVQRTLDNIRTGQIDENYFFTIDGSSPIFELCEGTATMKGKGRTNESCFRLTDWGSVSVIEDTEGVFKVSGDGFEWFSPATAEYYPTGNFGSQGTDEANSFGGWTDNIASTVQTTYAQEGTYGFLSMNSDNAAFARHYISITGLPTTGTKTLTFWVNQVAGTDGSIRITEEGNNTALATTSPNVIAISDTPGWNEVTVTIAAAETGFRLAILHPTANPNNYDTVIDTDEEWVIVDNISITLD